MLRLRWCSRVFSSGGALLLAEVAPLTAEHRLRQLQVPGSTAQLGRRGPRTSWLLGTWDVPGPGIEPVSPALAGGFLSPMPPGKPHFTLTFVFDVR